MRRTLLSVSAITFVLVLAGVANAATTLYWSGAGTWDNTTTKTWGTVSGGLYNTAFWGDSTTDVGHFEGTGGAVTVSGTITKAAVIDFDVDGYTVSGGTITLGSTTAGGTATINVASNCGATISATLYGSITGGSQYYSINAIGGGSLTLSGNSKYAGTTSLQGGVLTYSGASCLSGTAGGTAASGSLYMSLNANETTVLNVNTTGTVMFGGSCSIGGRNSGAGTNDYAAINQTSGLFQAGSMMILGNSASSAYGSYNLVGGTLTTTSGAYVGQGGIGVFTQTGGSASIETFTVGRNVTGAGVATFTGGSALFGTSTGSGLGVGTSSGTGTVNIGTEVGGNAMVAVGGTAGLVNLSYSGTNPVGLLNLNSGTLSTVGSIYKKVAGTAGVNFNGGVIDVAKDNIDVLAAGTIAMDYVRIYNGGGTINVGAAAPTMAMCTAILSSGTGNGIYVSGGSLAVNSGTGYIGAPQVTVSGGNGTGAMAVANVTGGVVTSVSLTCPGQGYSSGDNLTFTFASGGGGYTTPATFSYTLGTADVAANGTGGFTKTGSSSLYLYAVNTYAGLTNVANGTLGLMGTSSILNSSGVNIAAGAKFDISAYNGSGGWTLGASQTLSGNGSVTGNVLASGIVSPGNSVGTLTADSATFNAGSNLQIQLASIASYDKLIINNGLTVNGGTLTVSLLGAYSPSVGDTFDILDFASETGAFSVESLPALSAGLGWDTTNLYTTGVIAVVPEPGTLALLAAGLLGLIAYAWRKRK